MDTKIGIVTEQEEKGVYIAQFKVYDLAIFSYYVESDKECYIIDPTYDDIIYKDFIKKRGSTLKYVLLTHYHADFLSAHVDLGVPIIMGEKSKRSINKFQVKEMKDNQKFKIGKVETRVMATPGHTTESACFALANSDGKEFCIFTGDTVFLRQVGRPDLAVATDITSSDLAGMLYDSVQKIKQLDKSMRIYPGHGAGSSCGKSIGAGNFCTLGVQHESNYGFTITDRKEFIKKLVEGLPTPPSYFFYDAKINQEGTKLPYQQMLQRCKKPLQMQDFKKLIDKKIPVVDTRMLIKNGLIQGSFWMTAKGDIAGWLAMVLKPQEEFAIIVEQGKQEEIIERFLRIGYFNIVGFNAFDAQRWNLSKLYVLELKTYNELHKSKQYVHLDVRNMKQWEDQGHIEDSLLISLPKLMQEVQAVQKFLSVNKGKELVVNCKTGFRARFAASILIKHGIHPIVLNQNLDNLINNGFKMTEYKGEVSQQAVCCEIF